MKRKHLLIIVGIGSVVMILGIWTGLYVRHKQIVSDRQESIKAYNDSVEHAQLLEKQYLDSIKNAEIAENQRCLPVASDFIIMKRSKEEIYDNENYSSVTVSVNRPTPNPNLLSNLIDKGFKLVNTRDSKEEGEGAEYYDITYSTYERFFKDLGYIRIVYKTGICDNVTIDFPSIETLDNFLSTCKKLGYKYFKAYDSYMIPVGYRLNGEKHEDLWIIHEDGYMKIEKISSKEIKINVSGCI